jgi:hypothetical protein
MFTFGYVATFSEIKTQMAVHKASESNLSIFLNKKLPE